MTGLPKLPGLTFSDPTITKYHVPHKFDMVNGFQIAKRTDVGIGGRPLECNSVKYADIKDPVKYDPSLTYGRVRGPPMPQFVPVFVSLDKKCLTFKAFFKQTVVESPDEFYRIRPVNIFYFQEDDTITVIEPAVSNCGFPQGRLIRRERLRKDESGRFWHWKDFNIGKDICFNSFVFHIVDCDKYTREFMASQGIEINLPEEMPPDPYIMNRKLKMPCITRVTPPADDKLRRFLEYGGKILRFYAIWDNSDADFKDLKECIIYYHLVDDKIAIQEIHKPNDGCDPFPLLLKKTKLPKNWTDRPYEYPAVYLELTDPDVTEYYQPKDFRIGETIFVMGRRLLIYDCDKFTRDYYERVLRICQGPPINVKKEEKPPQPRIMPPHVALALGSIEDSLQNCYQTIPKPPKKDDVRMLINANKFLRYTMKLDWVNQDDSIRKFLMIYSLSEGKIQIYEPPITNSGILGGTFLKNMFIVKPNSDPLNPEYYTPGDFYIGGLFFAHGHRFIITGADLMVYRYMQANPEKFSPDLVDNVRNYMFNQGLLKDDITDKVEENQEKHRRAEIDAIGKHIGELKTDKEKCLESYANLHKSGRVRQDKDEPELENTDPKYGIRPVNKECVYPVITDKGPSSECEKPSYLTEEEKLQKYYDEVLQRHEEACLKSAEYKKHHECLPGTANIKGEKYGKHVVISEHRKPEHFKYNTCVDTTLEFPDPQDKCKQEKEDVYGWNKPKTHCDCSQ